MPRNPEKLREETSLLNRRPDSRFRSERFPPSINPSRNKKRAFSTTSVQMLALTCIECVHRQDLIERAASNQYEFVQAPIRPESAEQ